MLVALALTTVGAMSVAPAQAKDEGKDELILPMEKTRFEQFQPRTLKCQQMIFLMDQLLWQQGEPSERKKNARKWIFDVPLYPTTNLTKSCIAEIRPEYSYLEKDFPALWPHLESALMHFTGSDQQLVSIADQIDSFQHQFKRAFLKYLRAPRDSRADLRDNLSGYGLNSADLKELDNEIDSPATIEKSNKPKELQALTSDLPDRMTDRFHLQQSQSQKTDGCIVNFADEFPTVADQLLENEHRTSFKDVPSYYASLSEEDIFFKRKNMRRFVRTIYIAPAQAKEAGIDELILPMEKTRFEQFQPRTLKCPQMIFLMDQLAQQQGELSQEEKSARQWLFRTPLYPNTDLKRENITKIQPGYIYVDNDFPALWPHLKPALMHFTGSDQQLFIIADQIDSFQYRFKREFLEYLRAPRDSRAELRDKLSRYGLDSADLKELDNEIDSPATIEKYNKLKELQTLTSKWPDKMTDRFHPQQSQSQKTDGYIVNFSGEFPIAADQLLENEHRTSLKEVLSYYVSHPEDRFLYLHSDYLRDNFGFTEPQLKEFYKELEKLRKRVTELREELGLTEKTPRPVPNFSDQP